MEGIRSFIAIEVPQPLLARMGELQRELKRMEAGVNWVRPEGIHLTLKFLGSIPAEELEKLARGIAPVVAARNPFELRVHGLGCFPSSHKPRVIWVGIDRGGGEASSLQKVIEDTAAEIGFPREARPFKPHLTLGRVRTPIGRSSFIQVMEKQKEVEIGTFLAREVYLFKSELKPSGAVYTKLQAFPMGKNTPPPFPPPSSVDPTEGEG
jgi:2'-5' RNA ligase